MEQGGDGAPDTTTNTELPAIAWPGAITSYSRLGLSSPAGAGIPVNDAAERAGVGTLVQTG
jgi:hypothetical protein